MSLIEALNRLDKRYAWSLLGFVLAVIFGAVSVYTEFLRDRRPQLRFEIVSDASVLDVRERLGNLEILYDGLDIQKAKQSLRVVVVRIINIGAEDILIGHYDQYSPLGFHVSDGKLLRAEILSASNDYLRKTLRIHSTVSDGALFAPVILESNEWFTTKSLILHPEDSRPALQPVGKIAGVRDIRLVDSTEAAADPGFLATAFAGGLSVQAARLAVYFLGFIVLVIGVVAPIAATSGALAKRRRRKHVAQFKSLTKLTLADQDEYIFERYVENGIGYLRMLQRAAADEERLNEEVQSYEKQSRIVGEELEDEPAVVISSSGAPPPHTFRVRLAIEDMKRSGFISQQEGRWRVDPHLSETLKEFVQFVEIKGGR